MATEKQIQANRANARLSTGPKTDAGKARSRLNAKIHGILTNVFTGEDQQFIEEAKKKLVEDPKTTFRELLLERCATWVLRLERAKLFERELLQAKLDPTQYEEIVIEPGSPGLLDHMAMDEELLGKPEKRERVLVHEGHSVTVDDATIDRLTDTVHRYEITAENRLLKCIQLLKELGLL